MKRKFTLAFIFICFFMCLARVAPPEEVKKVAILPFYLNALAKFNYLKEGIYHMFFARLEREKIEVISKEKTEKAMAGLKIRDMPTERQVYQLAERLKADYLLYGKITLKDNNVRIALKLLNRDQNKTHSFFGQGEKGELLLKLSALAGAIANNILGKVVQKTTVQPENTLKHQSPPLHASEVKLPKWYSYPLSFAAKGLAIGDINGDGNNELLLMDDHTVWIYRYVKGVLALIKKKEFPAHETLLHIETCDVNQDGQEELLITRRHKKTIISEVDAWQGGRLGPLAKDLPWFLKVQTSPQGKKVILGQSELYPETFFHLIWKGQGFEVAGKMPSLPGVRVIDCWLADLTSHHTQGLLCLDKAHHLIWSAKNRKWRGQQSYQGLIVADLDKKPPLEVIVYQNEKKQDYQGQFKLLRWEHMGMKEVWSSPKLRGRITRGFIGDLDNDGYKDLVFTVVRTKQGTGFPSKETIVIAYDLRGVLYPR